MDAVLHLAVLLAGIAGAPNAGHPTDAAGIVTAAGTAGPPSIEPDFASLPDSRDRSPTAPGPMEALARQPPPAALQSSDAWLGEDKFRHAGASWAAMVFTYAAARAVQDDSDTALMVAFPVTAALGLAKEVADRRSGGPFSARDLVADALGAGVAWLFLREVR